MRLYVKPLFAFRSSPKGCKRSAKGEQRKARFIAGVIMKKVILAVLLIAIALFLVLPNLSWA